MKKLLIFIATLILGSILLFTACQDPAITSAKMYIQQEEWDKAIEQCNVALSTTPQNALAYFILGQAYGFKEMYREMNDAYTRSLKISDIHAADIEQNRNKYWVDIFNKGVALIKRDKLNEAIDEFKLATEILPARLDAYKNMAYAYVQLDDSDSAIETYKQAIEINPKDLELRNSLGVLYYTTKQYDQSIATLEYVLNAADPNSKMYATALQYFALANDLLGHSDKAIEAYKTALDKFPENQDLLFNYGRLLLIQKKFDEAITIYKKLYALNPEDYGTNLQMGQAYIEMERWEDAIPYLEKATELNPDNANAWNNLGVAYVRIGKTDEGKAAFDKSDELLKQAE